MISESPASRDVPSVGGGVFVRSGEPSRFREAAMQTERLVHVLRRDLIGYLQRKGLSVEDAEDLVQEAFARFYRAGHAVLEPDARPLLFVIARNLQTDRWKSAGRRRMQNAEDIHTLDGGPRAVVSDLPSADQHLIGRQNLAAAAAAIRALPKRTREAFLLHRFEDLTYRQIAGRLGVSVSMVEKHIAEALRLLKQDD